MILVVVACAVALSTDAMHASPYDGDCGTQRDGGLTDDEQFHSNGPWHVKLSYQTALSIAQRVGPSEFQPRTRIRARRMSRASSHRRLHFEGRTAGPDGAGMRVGLPLAGPGTRPDLHSAVFIAPAVASPKAALGRRALTGPTATLGRSPSASVLFRTRTGRTRRRSARHPDSYSRSRLASKLRPSVPRGLSSVTCSKTPHSFPTWEAGPGVTGSPTR